MRLFGFPSSSISSNALVYGLKFGIAGLLAIFLSLSIKLPEPTWALITVFVLMIGKHIGAIAEKSIFRILGTVAGGIIGYLITGAFEQNPWIYLTLLFLVMAFCTAMFGQNRYPYAFFLCGLTTLVVCSNGMTDPDFSWYYALWRIEEVCVGVISVLLVQSLFFPRYARLEFLTQARQAILDLQKCFQDCSEISFGNPNRKAVEEAMGFSARIFPLRNLLVFGSRESIWFRARLPAYCSLVDSLTSIAHIISTIDTPLPPESVFYSKIKSSATRTRDALLDIFADLASPQSQPESAATIRQKTEPLFSDLTNALHELRADPRCTQIPIEEAMTAGKHLLALEDIRDRLEYAKQQLETIASPEDGRHLPQLEPTAPAFPPGFWLRTGLKSGLAVVVAMILTNWLNPPGAGMFLLGSWVFTAMNPFSPSGKGDQSAYSVVVWGILVLLLYSIVLLLGSPMLASYAALNVILFVWLFLWGTLTDKNQGFTIPMQFSLLCAVGLLGLNGQQPVSFQAIADLFFGLALALILAGVIGRTIMPTLPQWDLRDRILELIALCKELLSGSSDGIPLWKRTRLSLLPGECALRIQLLSKSGTPPEQTELLSRYVSLLARTGQDLLAGAKDFPAAFPKTHADEGVKTLSQIRQSSLKLLSQQDTTIRKPSSSTIQPDNLPDEIEQWVNFVAETRKAMILANRSIPEVTHFLGLAARTSRWGKGLLAATDVRAKIDLQHLTEDNRL